MWVISQNALSLIIAPPNGGNWGQQFIINFSGRCDVYSKFGEFRVCSRSEKCYDLGWKSGHSKNNRDLAGRSSCWSDSLVWWMFFVRLVMIHMPTAYFCKALYIFIVLSGIWSTFLKNWVLVLQQIRQSTFSCRFIKLMVTPSWTNEVRYNSPATILNYLEGLNVQFCCSNE